MRGGRCERRKRGRGDERRERKTKSRLTSTAFSQDSPSRFMTIAREEIKENSKSTGALRAKK